MLIVIMGVCGSGKSTIGRGVAERLNLPFFEGDDYHSERNIQKMSEGIPLNDRDRRPWLKSINDLLRDSESKYGAVFTCSALKQSYRDLLEASVEKINWVFLHGSERTLRKRMLGREGHFMKTNLLESQLSILEEPSNAIKMDILRDPNTIINNIIRQLLNE